MYPSSISSFAFGLVDFQDEEHEPEGGDPRGATTFQLRPLTVGALMDIRGGMPPRADDDLNAGTQMVKALGHGLANWKNFWGIIRGPDGEVLQEVAFDPMVVSHIPYVVRHRIVREIWRISTINDEFEEKLRNAVRTAHLRGKQKQANDWNCDHCMTKPGLQRLRKCPLGDGDYPADANPIPEIDQKYLKPWDHKNLAKGKLPKWISYGGHKYDQCPVGLTSRPALDWLGLVLQCEAGGYLPCHPPSWFEQPYLYAQAQAIIHDERAAIKAIEKEGKDVAPIDTPKQHPVKPGRKLGQKAPPRQPTRRHRRALR